MRYGFMTEFTGAQPIPDAEDQMLAAQAFSGFVANLLKTHDEVLDRGKNTFGNTILNLYLYDGAEELVEVQQVLSTPRESQAAIILKQISPESYDQYVYRRIGELAVKRYDVTDMLGARSDFIESLRQIIETGSHRNSDNLTTPLPADSLAITGDAPDTSDMPQLNNLAVGLIEIKGLSDYLQHRIESSALTPITRLEAYRTEGWPID